MMFAVPPVVISLNCVSPPRALLNPPPRDVIVAVPAVDVPHELNAPGKGVRAGPAIAGDLRIAGGRSVEEFHERLARSSVVDVAPRLMIVELPAEEEPEN